MHERLVRHFKHSNSATLQLFSIYRYTACLLSISTVLPAGLGAKVSATCATTSQQLLAEVAEVCGACRAAHVVVVALLVSNAPTAWTPA